MLPLRARLNLGAMAMKGYSAFPKAPPLLDLHYHISFTPLLRCSWCILQPQLTGPIVVKGALTPLCIASARVSFENYTHESASLSNSAT